MTAILLLTEIISQLAAEIAEKLFNAGELGW